MHVQRRGSVSYASVFSDSARSRLLAVHETPREPQRPRLLDRVREALRARHYSRRTEESYVAWIRRYIFFHGKRHPIELGAPEVTRFLTWLAVEGRVAASTQNQALSALLFLYREVLEVDLPWLDGIVRAKRPEHVPVILARDEVRALLQRLDGVPRLMAYLLYGAGLRVLECCRLQVQDVDFAANQIVIRAGKGNKDRVTMLPAVAKADLASHLQAVRAQHEDDLAHGAGWVELPTALRRKYPNAPRQWVWQWVFPSDTHLSRAAHRRTASSPSARIGAATGGQGCRLARRDRQARQPSHAAPFVRHAPARGWSRYPDRSRAAGAPRREHDDDLYPRPEPGTGGRAQPCRQGVRPMTWPAVLPSKPTRIGCRISQPISTAGAPAPGPQHRGIRSPRARAIGTRAVGIDCRNPQQLQRYADRPILWPNSSCPNHEG